MYEDAPFFLSAAGENKELAEPRACWEIGRMRDPSRDDYMLISVEPPFRQQHGIGYIDQYKLIIASRFKSTSLYPIVSWPCHVFVFRILNEEVTKQMEFRPEDVRLIAWGMLFQRLNEAESHYRKF